MRTRVLIPPGVVDRRGGTGRRGWPSGARALPAGLCAGAALCVFAAWAVPAAQAQPALRRWTFEQHAYGGPTRSVSDHCYLQAGGLWHFFYTHLETPEEPLQYIGHAVSDNLRDWSERPPVVVAGPEAPEWRRLSVWAPMAAALPTGGCVLAFAGVDMHAAQRIGFLFSDDLDTWTDLPGSVPFEPDTARYKWPGTEWSDCRDPHLLWEDGLWHLLFAGRNKASVGVVGHATSPDLLTWTQFDPLLTASGPKWYLDLESPGMVHFRDHYLLYYALGGAYVIRADSLSGPWQAGNANLLDNLGAGGELVPDGDGLFFSRQRMDPCRQGRIFTVWTDSLDTSSWPFQIVPWARLPGFLPSTGDAFLGQPSYGDGPELRGEPPAAPSALFWLSSREFSPEPRYGYPCALDRGAEPSGWLRTEPFVLSGDTVAVRVSGADSPDSAYVMLRDACTCSEIVRLVGSGPTLAPVSAYVGMARGRSVQWQVVDALDRPGGWIGVDDMEERAAPGLPSLAAQPAVAWALPAGGENFAGLSNATLSWQVDDASGLDSQVVFLTYDGGESLLRQATLDDTARTYPWTVPDTVAVDVRLRLVAFSRSGVSGCATSSPFRIGATAAAESPPAIGALRALYGSSGAWLEGSVPAGNGEPAVLELFDLRGRRLRVLWRGRDGEAFRVAVDRAGSDGPRLRRGVYFARLEAGARTWSARLVLLAPGGP